ncbi:MAG: acetyl-CoA synthetase [Proteobacteria bacterium]|nr:acetyl-CoA synthetase [Pseudomonadota bacterium]
MTAAAGSLDRLFYPKTVAVIGASPKKSGFAWGGNTFIEGMIKCNFQGKIYPVHPKADSILGLQTYPSLLDIPGEIDLAIFSIPHSQVLKVMTECAEKKVKFVHSFTAGFSETNKKEHIELERQLLEIAKNAGIRVVGPNCMGVFCPEGGMSWSKSLPDQVGSVGFISQSGQLAGHFTGTGDHHGLRFSKVVSFGNAGDLKAHDFLSYLAEDDKTRIIGAYIEGLKDGRAFFEAAKKVAGKKPLVVWKGGRTEGGSRAVSSHTGSLAGSVDIWKALCKQVGIISVDSLDELVFTIIGLQKLELPKSPRVAILGGAGGGSVTMTDVAESEGLTVPSLSQESIRELEKFVPIQGNSVKNPLDMMATLFNQDYFIKTMKLLRDDPNVDAVIFSQPVHWSHEVGGRAFLDMFIQLTHDGMKAVEKPMLIALEKTESLDGVVVRREAFEKYNNVGIAAFPSFQSAAQVMFKMCRYREFLESRT